MSGYTAILAMVRRWGRSHAGCRVSLRLGSPRVVLTMRMSRAEACVDLRRFNCRLNHGWVGCARRKQRHSQRSAARNTTAIRLRYSRLVAGVDGLEGGENGQQRLGARDGRETRREVVVSAAEAEFEFD